jgi:hypothetical protein
MYEECVDNAKMDLKLGGMNCIDVAEDGDQWKVLVNTVMHPFRFHNMQINS